MFESLNFKTMKFRGALTFIISITSLAYTNYFLTGNYMTFFRAAILTDIYFLIALASENINDMQNIFIHTYDIYHTPLPDTDKIMQIREFLESAMTRWANYWRMYEDIVKGEKSHYSYFPDLLSKIRKGEISIGQFTWIFGSYAYAIAIAEDLVSITAPIDYMIMFAVLGIILFSSGKVSGLGETFGQLFRSLKFKSKEQIRSLLDLIEKTCKDAMNYYYAITLKMDNNTTK